MHLGDILSIPFINNGVNCYNCYICKGVNYYICKGDEMDEGHSMDNTSLAAMYGESHSSVTTISQPETKRSHTEDDFVEIIHSQSSCFHEPVNSPHVDTQVAPEMGEEKLARDRRPLKLSRNKFAVNRTSGDRKTGFSLNTSSGEEVREVKSRYSNPFIIELFIYPKKNLFYFYKNWHFGCSFSKCRHCILLAHYSMNGLSY